jgi:hypothetical protein
MRSTILFAAAAALILGAGAGFAQQGGTPAAPGASAARPGYGPGGGPGPRGGMRFGFGSDFTPGWGMMTPQERDQHRQQMGNAKTPEECRQVRDEHRKLMQERARARGIASMPGPRRDACAGAPG